MNKLIITLSFFICFSSFGQSLKKEQQIMISILSGNEALPNGKTITNRSSFENRHLTRAYLSSLIEELGLVAQIQNYKMPNVNPLVDLLFNPFVGANLYTVLLSTIPSDEFIIMGAHLDTERNCPGAIDNATGMAIIYSTLKKLKLIKTRNKNVIVVFFDQEEEILTGSEAFAKYCVRKKMKIHSMHNFDTMGWDADNDKAVELDMPSDTIKAFYAKHAEKLNIPFHTTIVNTTDDHSFRALGFDAVGLSDEYVNGDFAPYKDTDKDTYDTVNFDYVASCTNLVFETIKDILTQ